MFEHSRNKSQCSYSPRKVTIWVIRLKASIRFTHLFCLSDMNSEMLPMRKSEHTSYCGTILFFVQSTRCLQGEWVGHSQVKYPGNTSNTCPALLQEILQREGGGGGGGEDRGGGGHLFFLKCEIWSFTTVISQSNHRRAVSCLLQWDERSHISDGEGAYKAVITLRQDEGTVRNFHLKDSYPFCNCTLIFLRIYLLNNFRNPSMHSGGFGTGYNFDQTEWWLKCVVKNQLSYSSHSMSFILS